MRSREHTLLLERVARARWPWWLALHVVALIIQLACVRAAPIVMQKTNAAGWWALCITAKGP
jgi:hypothetical protein